MATLTPYVAQGTHKGQEVAVKVRKFIWLNVGRGKVLSFDEFEVEIGGKIDVMGYKGDLLIHLTLKDRAPRATAGGCGLRLNEFADENARYETSNGTITVFATLGGRQQNIAVRPTNNGSQTECRLFGNVNETVHLEPTH